MAYPQMPAHLDSPEQIMSWLKLVEAESNTFAAEVASHTSSDTLTEEVASSYLDKFTWVMAAADRAFEAMERVNLDSAVKASLTATAGASHEFGDSMAQLLFDQLRDSGANANLLFDQAQDRHYS